MLFDFGGTLDSDGIPWKERFFRLWTNEGEESPGNGSTGVLCGGRRARGDDSDDALASRRRSNGSPAASAKASGRATKLCPNESPARFCEDARENLSRSAELLERARVRATGSASSPTSTATSRRSAGRAGIGPALSAAVDSAEVGCTQARSGDLRGGAVQARRRAGGDRSSSATPSSGTWPARAASECATCCSAAKTERTGARVLSRGSGDPRAWKSSRRCSRERPGRSRAGGILAAGEGSRLREGRLGRWPSRSCRSTAFP